MSNMQSPQPYQMPPQGYQYPQQMQQQYAPKGLVPLTRPDPILPQSKSALLGYLLAVSLVPLNFISLVISSYAYSARSYPRQEVVFINIFAISYVIIVCGTALAAFLISRHAIKRINKTNQTGIRYAKFGWILSLIFLVLQGFIVVGGLLSSISSLVMRT